MSEKPPLHVVLDRSKRLRQATERLGLSSDTTLWSGWHVKYQFICLYGHRFSTTPVTLVSPTAKGCPECSAQRSMQVLLDAVQLQGVSCLSTQWKGEKSVYDFYCGCGHQWQRNAKNALRHPGCPACVKRARYQKTRLTDGLERLQKAAEKKGGRCLNETYLGTGRRHQFICAQEHTWSAMGHEILRDSWCQRCGIEQSSRQRLHPEGFERLRALAASHGGICLSDGEYLGVRQHVRFRCKEGHEWETLGRRVIRGTWCPICSIDKRRLTLADAQNAASAHGGQCLSMAYENNAAYMEWLCHRGHHWRAPLAVIRAGHWCAQCAVIARISNSKSKALIRYTAAPE